MAVSVETVTVVTHGDSSSVGLRRGGGGAVGTNRTNRSIRKRAHDQYPLTTFWHKLFMNFTISESICVLCRVSVNLRQSCFKIKRFSLGIKQFKRTITRITDPPTKPMTFLTILIEVLYGFFFAREIQFSSFWAISLKTNHQTKRTRAGTFTVRPITSLFPVRMTYVDEGQGDETGLV